MAARYKLAPSILSADFDRLGEEVARIEKHADLLHVDAMHGHFVLPQIEAARAEVDRRGLDVAIAVDGGIDLETGRDALDAGANVLGAASAIFSRPDPAEAARALKELLNEREANA